MNKLISPFKSLLLLVALSALVIGCRNPKLESGGAYAPTTPVVENGVTNHVATVEPDINFYRADLAFSTLYAAADGIFKFEHDNRMLLWKLSPQIKRTLDKIRPEAVAARNAYIMAREAYVAHPTPSGLTALEQALSKVKGVTAAAQAAVAEFQRNN